MSKAKLTLASGVGLAALLTGSAAHVARAEVVSFQNGVNGYTGTFDRKIGLTTSNDADGSSVNTDTRSYFIDGGGTDLNDSGVIQGLIRFDNIIGAGAIPSNALIISASLDMVTTTFSNSQSNGAYTVYGLNTPVNSSTTYASLGGDGIYNNVSRIGGSFNRPKISTAAAPVVTSARVDQIVQDWVKGGTNYGFGIRSDNNIDGWSPNTTGAATVANRPKLSVEYTTNPNARLLHYQQNVNGYDGTIDSFINGINGATVGTPVSGAAVEHGFLDGSNGTDSYDQPYLVKFDNIDLSLPKITRAELILHTGYDNDNSGTGGSFSVHRILKPWDTGTAYGNLTGASDTDKTYNPISELITEGFIAPASTETGQIGNAAVLNLNITDIVKAWKDGSPNYGIYIGSTGTADGWELCSSGAYGVVGVDDVSGQLAPELSLLYVPDPLLVGDVNGDGIVNQTDLSAIVLNWQKTGQARSAGDLNGDGIVNQTDLSEVVLNWQKTAGSSSIASSSLTMDQAMAMVPEPTSVGVLTLGAGTAVLRRRRRI